MSDLRKSFENVKATLEYAGFGVDGLVMVSIKELEKVISKVEELTKPKTETRVYVVDVDKLDDDEPSKFEANVPDEEFISEAERQGSIYTLPAFQKAFNSLGVDTNKDFIRFISFPVHE